MLGVLSAVQRFRGCSGTYTVTLQDGIGRQSGVGFSVIRDTTPPTLTLAALVQGDVHVTWSATDPDSGVDASTCLLEVREDEGTWQTFSTECGGDDTHDGQPGHTYTFRLSASDNVSNAASLEVQAVFPYITKYYYANGQRVAMRQEGVVYYIHADHLGSTSLTTDQNQQVEARQLYHPYGTPRWSQGTLPTDYTFTGQRDEAGIGLMHYGARFYSPRLGRFVSADSIVPEPGEPQALNRYAYVANNPVLYRDPSGHCIPGVNCPGDLYEEAPTLVSDVERLVGMFGGSKEIPATIALERVLAYTRSPGFKGKAGVQFGVKFGDTGFKEEFRDSHLYSELWGMSYLDSNQVGHFLTAASLGYEPILGSETASTMLIIGHEKVSDAGLSRSTTSGPVGDPFALSEQIAAGMVGYLSSEGIVFEVACTSDKSESYEQRDTSLGLILGSGDLAKRRGNSMEDLRLSVKGWIMGQMIASGELKTNRDVADWLTTNLAAP